MASTIQLFLLENKSIQAKVGGYPYSYEGGYNIVAGDQNATEFAIVSVPSQYADFDISLAMKNARGQNVKPPDIIDNKFMLPIGMAVAGYGNIVITLHKGSERAVFLPLKIKVANTDDNWSNGIINGTIAIGAVETLPPDSEAYAVNVGTVNDAIINLGIPEGVGFKIDITYSSVAEMNESFATDGVRLYGFAIIDTGNVNDQDNAKLFIKCATEYKYLTDLSGAQGIQGRPGAQGVGILSITFKETTAVGNVYTITLTNGATSEIVTPKGEKGDPADTENLDARYVQKSGDTITGPLICKENNDFITRNNEFNFGDPNGTQYFQYRNANVTSYRFCNGDGAGGLANVVGKELYEDTERVYSPNNMPTGVKDYNSPEHTVRLSGSKKNTWANTTYVPVFDGTGYDICYANKPTAEDIGAVPDNGTAKGQVPVSTLTTGGDATWVFPMAEVTSASTAVAGHLFTSYNLLNGNNCAIQTKIKNNYKWAIQWGQVDSSGSSATFASVTFPRRFWNTPKVFATYHATNTGSIADSYGWVKRDSVSTTGCTIRSYGGNSVVWIAIGVVSGD